MIKAYFAFEVPQIWHKVEKYIKKALDRGSAYTLYEIYELLLNGKCQLWTWTDQEITTVLTTTVYDRTCLLLTFAGENLNSIECYNLVEKWAAHEGCDRMLIHGRKAWTRILGFEIEGKDDLGLYVMSKRLGTIDEQWTESNQFQPDTADFKRTGVPAARASECSSRR